MRPATLLQTAIIPALAELPMPDTLEARRFLLAIALQESGLRHRRQIVNGTESGPATSFWQFERGGGCRGVMTHPATVKHMERVCADYNIEPSAYGLWLAMQYQDIVAACAARLLIYTLPSPLPTTAEQGWKQYLEAWRPGKPHPGTWARHWETADKAAREAS